MFNGTSAQNSPFSANNVFIHIHNNICFYYLKMIHNYIQCDMYCDLVHCQYNVGQGCEITQVKVATKAVLVVTSLAFFGQHYFISI